MTQHALTTILLIEDSPSDVRLIEELLYKSSHQSFNVITASTLAGGLELLSANSVDAILLDLGLPDSQGIDTVRVVHERASHLPIIVLTVSDDEELGERALQEGAQRFITKDAFTLGVPYAGIFTRMIRFAIAQARAEAALVKSEGHFHSLFNSSAIAQVYYDATGYPIRANAATLALFGIPDVTALQHMTIFSSPRLSDDDKTRLRAGEPVEYEQEYDFDAIKASGGFTTTNSGTRNVHVFFTPLRNTKTGTPDGYLGQITDITERVRAERLLQTAHQDLQALNEELRCANEELEQRVQERTAKLQDTSEELALMNEELQSTNEELRVSNEELRHETTERTRAEQEARARAEQLQRSMTMVDLANDAIIMRDLNDHIAYWNRGAERLYGWDAQEAAGRIIHTFLHTEHPIPLTEIGKALFDTGGWVGELIHTTKDGRRITVESHQTLQFDTVGKPSAIFEINTDVTEKKQSEDDLARELEITSALARLYAPLLSPSSDHEALTLAILDEAKHLTGSAHGFVALIDPHTQDVVAYGHTQMMLEECAIPHERRQVRFPISPNGRYHELWGYPLNEKKGFFTNAPSEHPASTGAPEGHAKLEQFLAVPVLLGGEAVGEIALANPGRDYARRDVAAVERLAEVFALTVIRMQVEERLRATSLYARSLIEASLDPLVTINAEGKITDVNIATEEATGRSRDELIGSDFSDYFTEPNNARSGYTQVFADGFVRDYPLAIRHTSGTVTDVLYNASVYRDEAGEVLGVFAAARDVTDRKRAEEELQRYSDHLEDLVEERTAQLKDAERLAGIGETAAMIGHDLRNPLQGLQYIVDLQKLRFERAPPEKRTAEDWQKEQALFDRISEQIFYMDKIVGDLQDYARPITPEHEEITLSAVIDDVLQSFPPTNGEVDTVVNVSDLTIVADPHLMLRVLSNLVLNALQAMPHGGTLTINATSVDDFVAIHITDTGVGIPADMRDKVFSPLTTGKAKGTGLGLAVVKRIVEAHGGTIEFASEEGKGTTFTVTLPQTAE